MNSFASTIVSFILSLCQPLTADSNVKDTSSPTEEPIPQSNDRLPVTPEADVSQGEVFEASFESAKAYQNPFLEIEVDVIFRKGEKQWKVPAFGAGDKQNGRFTLCPRLRDNSSTASKALTKRHPIQTPPERGLREKNPRLDQFWKRRRASDGPLLQRRPSHALHWAIMIFDDNPITFPKLDANAKRIGVSREITCKFR